MCGLVGVMRFESWGLSYGDREMFEQLLIAGSLRGTHGTGVIVVNSAGESRSLKIGSDPFKFFADKQCSEFLEPKKPNGYTYSINNPHDAILLGHNRYATTGSKSTEHAHPHRVGDILLLHNGTLRSYSDLPRYKSFEVDTQALANGIDELGIDEAIAKTHGAYALMYVNRKESTVNIIRNDERPLHYVYDDFNKKWIWASERKMLDWIISRQKTFDSSKLTIEEFPKDTLFTFNLLSEKPYIPERREVKGPTTFSYNRGVVSWVEENEVALMDVMDYHRGEQPKKAIKRASKAVNNLKKLGIEVKVLKEHIGLVKGDPVVFRVTDYVDENPDEESFIILGESPTMPKTSLRFRLKGAKILDALFCQPNVQATIKNMLNYPGGNEEGDNFVIWVGEPEIHIPPATNLIKGQKEEKVDMYGRKLYPVVAHSSRP